MSNGYYTSPTDVAPASKARSVDINTIDSSVDAAFDKLPTPAKVAASYGNYAVDTGAVNAYAMPISAQITVYEDGQEFVFKAAHTSTITTPTLTPGALAAKTIVAGDGNPLAIGDIISGQFISVRYDAATDKLQMQFASMSAVSQAAAYAAAAQTYAGNSLTYANASQASANVASASAAAAAASAEAAATFDPAAFIAKAGGSLSGALNLKRATVAGHATNADIWAAAGNDVDMTGTPTITDFPDAPQAGASRTVYPAAGTVFTNNANIAVQGGANFTAAAGDIVTVRAITTSTFRVTVDKANGNSVAGGGGSMILLSTVTASNSATVDVETTIDSTYDAYVIVATGVTCDTDTVKLGCQLKQGGSYVAINVYQYHTSQPTSSGTAYAGASSGGDYQITMHVDNLRLPATVAGSHVAFQMFIPNPSGTVHKKAVYWNGVISSAQLGPMSGAGNANLQTALTGVRFKMSSGNIAAGTFRLYGIKNS